MYQYLGLNEKVTNDLIQIKHLLRNYLPTNDFLVNVNLYFDTKYGDSWTMVLSSILIKTLSLLSDKNKNKKIQTTPPG